MTVTARLSPPLLKTAAIVLAVVVALMAMLAVGERLMTQRSDTLRRAVFEEAVTVRSHGAALAFAKALLEDWQRTKWTAERIGTLGAAQRQEAVEALVSTPGRVSWAGFADVTGRVRVASGGLLLGKDVSARPWFRQGLRGPYAGDAHEALLLQQFLGTPGKEPLRFLDFAIPVMGPTGVVEGVFCVHIDAGWAEAYLADIARTLDLDLMLVDRSGTISIGGARSGAEARPRDMAALVAGPPRLMDWTDGGQYFTAVVPHLGAEDLPSFGWRLVARIRPVAFANLPTSASDMVRLLLADSEAVSLKTVLAGLVAVALTLGAVAVFYNLRALQAGGEARSAMKRLATSEQRFLKLFGSASLPMAVVRGETYQVVNEAAARLLGYDRPEALEGRSFLDISPEIQADGIRSVDRTGPIEAELIANGTARFDWLHIKADGTTILLDILLTVVQAETERDVFAVWSDVTERRRSEELVRDYQAMLERAVAQRTAELEATHAELRSAKDQSDHLAQLRSDFLATMSHEIRGPLNSLLGFVELASDGTLSEQQSGFLAKASQAGRHLASIVDHVLDLTRAEAGKIELERLSFDLIDFAHAVTEAIEPALRDKPVELIFEACPDLPRRVTADPLRIRQILMNYLTNAAKFTQSGEIRLSLRKTTREGKDYLRFAVIDTGIGLSPAQRERLFQAFTQGDISTARLYGGSGLGLAICRQLASLMQGQVGLDSDAGKGSAFWFDLPFEGHVAEAAPTARPALGAGKTVWLGIAHPRVRSNLRGWLERDGFRVAEMGADPPPDGPGTVLVYEAAARAQAPWLDGAGYPDRFILCCPRTAPTEMTPRMLRVPVNPLRLIALLAPLSAPAEVKAGEAPLPLDYGGRFKVLVADDDELNRDLASARLARMGLSVRTAQNGTEALQAALEEPFDLILMDHQMPVINGIEATRRIRAFSQARAHLPIIGVSGSDRPEVRQACLGAGMDGFILKPLSTAKLRDILTAHLPA